MNNTNNTNNTNSNATATAQTIAHELFAKHETELIQMSIKYRQQHGPGMMTISISKATDKLDSLDILYFSFETMRYIPELKELVDDLCSHPKLHSTLFFSIYLPNNAPAIIIERDLEIK